jgi:dTDP-4-dehydrorhamnose 3,5-epimerase
VRLEALPVAGAHLVYLTPHSDERGFFARSWCAEEFDAAGLDPELAQCNISFNRLAGTLRGLHFETGPDPSAKLVRCTTGVVYDVILDLRPESPTYRAWCAAELSAGNRRMAYVPPGCAHGFQTLEDGSEVFYQMSRPYRPETERGVRWDDPAFGIAWPDHAARTLSERDRSYPDYRP